MTFSESGSENDRTLSSSEGSNNSKYADSGESDSRLSTILRRNDSNIAAFQWMSLSLAIRLSLVIPILAHEFLRTSSNESSCFGLGITLIGNSPVFSVRVLPNEGRRRFGCSQKVWMLPFPLAETGVSRGVSQCPFPKARSCSAVACETWMRFFSPVLSIRDATLMVSPNSWNRDFSPLSTPAVTGPLCRPNLIPRLAVPGPRVASSLFVMTLNLRRHLTAYFAMTTAWSSRGSGRPVTAT
mmetsp:Transcript_30735/g.73203  ORF Transcript_30735/g.73203 Transcript_30735/m.73203 type:complete len:241 (-) Transcript_30735:1204-1926(-)